MEKQVSARNLSNAEFALLCCFSVALPLVEAPKNIFLGLFVLMWVGRSLRLRNFGQISRAWDAVFAGLIIAPALCTLLTPYMHQWKEVRDVFGYVSLGWVVARSRLNRGQVYWLIACLVGATLLGLAQGYWVLATDPKRMWLQLNSVGHVNHSALYGAGIGVLSMALLSASWSGASKGARVALAGVALVMLGAMMSFASRGALVAYIAGLLPVVMVLGRLRVRSLLVGLVLAAVLGGGLQFITIKLSSGKNDQTLLAKTLQGVQQGDISSMRVQLFRVAIEEARQRPWTGMGPANFNAVSMADVERWVEARGESFEANRYFIANHAHNLYGNTLAERGLLGLAALATLAIGWSIALIKRYPSPDGGFTERMAWGAGVAGWTLVLVGGLFNTTLHHEHGMLAMLCLGLLLNGVPLRGQVRAVA